MRRRFFKGFSKDIDLADPYIDGNVFSQSSEQYVKNEKERFVPFSVNPFRPPQHSLLGRGGHQDDTDSERPPEWLELAGDLAWTATFSSLTSNTTVTEPNSVWNYAVFFGLTWHLWATQTTYDIKYYTNDWWHRVFFASQLGVYAVLASFSGSFNVGWKVNPDALAIFVGNSTELTAEAMLENQEILIEKSFRGINVMLFISRLFLLVQYLRVLWYRRRSDRFWSWRFILAPLATFGAGCIFLVCFIMMKDLAGTRTVAVAQLSLWAVAIVIQIMAAAFTPEDGNMTLKSSGAMAPRLSTLTVIIMGEGLNAICATLRNSINSLGLTPRTVSESITMLLILYFVWLLYFDGFRIKYSPSKVLEEVWLWLHFPLHLSLILLLEGIKNLFIYVNVLEALTLLETSFAEVLTSFKSSGKFPDHPKLEKLLIVLKMSWKQEVADIWAAAKSDTTGTAEKISSQLWRWWGTVTHNVILMYNEEPDPEGEYWFNKFVGSSDAVVADDMNNGGPLFLKFTSRYDDLMAYSVHWLIAVSGTLLVCMAILNVMQRRPRNRFAWGYSLSRTIVGFVLIILGGATSNLLSRGWFPWIIPAMSIGYAVAVVVDWVLLYLSVTSIRKKEALSRAQILYSSIPKIEFDTSPGIDPAMFQQPHHDFTPSTLPYAQPPTLQSRQSGQSVNAPTLYSQVPSSESTAQLYPAPVAGAAYSGTQVTDPYASEGHHTAGTSYPPRDMAIHRARLQVEGIDKSLEPLSVFPPVQVFLVPSAQKTSSLGQYTEADPFFKGFSAPVDLKDDQYVKNEKERYVRFSVNPFRESRLGTPGKAEEEGERPPEWLELAGDLAWTATFSSLTSNTSVTEPSAVWNYAVFFCLTWHLWATQTTYDIRYYTNDWWHRVLFASQLGVYAILAAYSGSFNVSWQIDPDATDVFKGNTTELTGQAMDENQEYLITKSFRGINAMMFISRILLFSQYVRVMFYRKRSQQFWSWRFLLTPLALLFSAGVFLGCFIMIKEDPDSKTVALTQLILWGLAVLSQAITGAFTPDDGHGVLKSEGAMAPRLQSLTVIILGEGLNAICGTLRNSMNSLGLSKVMVGQSLCVLLILYFIWLLYFDGFRIKYSPSKVLEELWLYLHFPLHLSLILLLEGVKNVFIYTNVIESFERLSMAFEDVTNDYTSSATFPDHPKLEKLLRVLQLSWQQEKNDLLQAIQKDNADAEGDGVNVASQIWRWWATVVHSVILVRAALRARALLM
ncbi:hypothetical protein FRB90_002266 [Tulasnella sp. 427]|nr:hypothetical protein FRB90_002266 [Tulasnella sp. 427]